MNITAIINDLERRFSDRKPVYFTSLRTYPRTYAILEMIFSWDVDGDEQWVSLTFTICNSGILSVMQIGEDPSEIVYSGLKTSEAHDTIIQKLWQLTTA